MHDEKGNFYGLDVELAQDIAAKLGVEVEFKRDYSNFSGIVDGIARHEADVAITLLSRTPDRAKKVRFTKPYIILRQGLLISRIRMAQRPRHLTLMEILNDPGSEIGVKAGTSYVAFARQRFPLGVIREYPEWDPDIINAVLKGEVIAAFHDEIEIKKVVIGKPEKKESLRGAVGGFASRPDRRRKLLCTCRRLFSKTQKTPLPWPFPGTAPIFSHGWNCIWKAKN